MDRADDLENRPQELLVVRSFPPVADSHARILILGSMPGQASLTARQYYAHPRNAFWPILGELLGFSSDLPYPQRLERLKSRGIALWDVLHSCSRRGSLDADIDEDSILPNAIGRFLQDHGAIRQIYFNGAKSEQAYRRYIQPSLGRQHGELIYQRLPSTSPAHAARTMEQKLEAWRVVVRDLSSRSDGEPSV